MRKRVQYSQIPEYLLTAVSGNSYKVYGALDRMASRCENETVMPTEAELALKTNLTEKTVRGCIKELLGVGALSVESHPGHPKVVTLEQLEPRQSLPTPSVTVTDHTIYEIITEKGGGSKNGKGKVPTPDRVPPELWEEWLSYRRRRRLTLDPVSYIPRAIRDLNAMRDPAAAIESSLRNGYAGLFESDQKKPADNSTPFQHPDTKPMVMR